MDTPPAALDFKVFSALMAACIGLVFFGVSQGYPGVIVLNTVAFLLLLLLLRLEQIYPHRIEWNTKDGERLNDVGHTLFGTAIGSWLGNLLVQVVFVSAGVWICHQTGVSFWPKKLNFGLQVALVFFIADLGRYWQHRLLHSIPLFWRFHSLHHSGNHLNVLKTSRSHIGERIFQQVFMYSGLALLGAPAEAIYWYIIPNTFLGLFAHSNIGMDLGIIEYVIMGPGSHRIHHSEDAHEGNSNFGSAIVLWDILFGTYINPSSRPSPIRMGIKDDRTPKGFIAQVAEPFQRQHAPEVVKEKSKRPAVRSTRGREIISHEVIRQKQRNHFYLLDLLPLAGSILAVPILMKTGLTKIDGALFFVFWVLTGLGIEMGYHRYFTHSAFVANEKIKALLIILGAMTGQGPVLSWASNHRHHHKYSDHEGDTHSPHLSTGLRGFAHAHLLWKYTYPFANPKFYTPDLLADKTVEQVDRHYFRWVILGIALPTLLGGLLSMSFKGALTAFLFAGVIRLTLGQNTTWCINSICHLFGQRPFKTKDHSRNNPFLVIPSLGACWHNNHHAFPYTAKNSLFWWQLDPTYWLIAVMKKIGWVSKVRVVAPEARDRLRRR